MTDQCTFSSFCHAYLKQLRQLRPGKNKYRIGAIFGAGVPDDFLQQAKDCGATEIHMRYDTCTVDRIKAIREAGMPSMAYSPGPVELGEHMTDTYKDIQSERHLYEMVLATGVDMFCCNRPDVVLDMLKGRAKKDA
jgi:glycerophosphoryl diester phosphodiesterase